MDRWSGICRRVGWVGFMSRSGCVSGSGWAVCGDEDEEEGGGKGGGPQDEAGGKRGADGGVGFAGNGGRIWRRCRCCCGAGEKEEGERFDVAEEGSGVEGVGEGDAEECAQEEEGGAFGDERSEESGE